MDLSSDFDASSQFQTSSNEFLTLQNCFMGQKTLLKKSQYMALVVTSNLKSNRFDSTYSLNEVLTSARTNLLCVVVL